MNEKPEALRLAELLNEATTVLDEPFHHNAIAEDCDKAAAELRRLHAENERLRKAVEELLDAVRSPGGATFGHIPHNATREHLSREARAWKNLQAALRQEQPK